MQNGHKSAKLFFSKYFVVKRTSLLNRLMVRMDDLLGYGEPIRGRDKDFWEAAD